MSSSSGVLTDKEIDEFAVDMSLIDQALANLSLFEYDGFNPKVFRTWLIKYWNNKGKDKAAISTLIIEALSIVLMRGIKINLAGNHKMKTAALAAAQNLATNGVQMKPSPGAQAAEVITLGRIQASFPVETSLLLASEKARVVGDRPEGLPHLFCHSSIHSILPRDVNFDSEFMKALREWRTSFTTTIMPGKTQDQVKKSMDDFDPKIFSSTLYSDSERRGILQKAIAMEMKAASPEARTKYKALMLTDAAIARML